MLFTAFGLVSSTSATTNPVEFDGNATTCADVGLNGSDFFEGSTTSGQTVTARFTATVTSNQFVTISAVADGVTFQAIVVKGGDGYNVYNPRVANMQSPLNGGGNVPALSHWYACNTYVPPVPTTTTIAPTTTTIAPTTTAPTTTLVTTTTEQANEVVTTTTEQASEAVTTTTLFAGLGPVPTTTVGRALPVTGNGEASSEMLLLGFLLMGFGSVVVLLSRRPIES